MLFQVNLTNYQKKKILTIIRNGKDAGIRFSQELLYNNGGSTLLKLDLEQLKKIVSVLKSKKRRGVVLTISKQQIIEHLPKYSGGHIPMDFILDKKLNNNTNLTIDDKNKIIKQILFPIHPLSNQDIDAYFKLLNIENRVVSRDKLKRRHIKPNASVVLNLDNSDGNGTHWVCIINKRGDNSVLYFDSFGVEYPPQELLDYDIKNLIVNDSQLQHITSIKCGYYCLKMIKQILFNNKTYEEAIDIFSENPSEINEDLADDLYLGD